MREAVCEGRAKGNAKFSKRLESPQGPQRGLLKGGVISSAGRDLLRDIS